MTSSTDRIEKKIHLRAPRSRVWRALSDASEFGHWFGARIEQPFTPGAHIRGSIQPTQVDANVAALQTPHEGVPFEIVIERMEPERLFSFRWHPGAVDPKVDYSKEPMTLVEFELKDHDGGTLLVVVESGFDRIPLERRAKAFSGNDAGWAHMIGVIAKHVDGAA